MRRSELRATPAIRFAGAALVALALVASACASNGSGTGSGGATSAGGSTSPATTGATSPAAGGGGSAATVDTATVGSLGTVLVDSKGFTLYRLDGETSSKFLCTGGCTSSWPPLQASGAPTAGSGATGRLATVTRPDGTTQVTYDGIPLYTFAGDTKAGDANGEGVQNAWFAVAPDGTDAKGASGTTGGSSGGGRYGY